MNSHYGVYGGQYIAETLMPTLIELEKEYLKAKEDPAFLAEYRGLLTDYVGRESPLYYAKRLSESIGAPVHVVYGRKGKGQLVIDFANFDDLDALIARIAPDAKEEA